MKIDMHVHTCHSRRPNIWLLQKIGCPESFTDPVRCYNDLKKAGMGKVTFTDHNSIDGCLAVDHLPDTFISEEITAYFPEDRCKVHVLAYDISVEDHRIIQEKRSNLYILVDYLRENNIAHAIAHPLSAVNGRFTRSHFEKLLLLFNTFEINGDQPSLVNHLLRSIIEELTPEGLLALSRRHGLALFDKPWQKSLICGSDDHAATRYGSSFTQAKGAQSLLEFFACIKNGGSSIHVDPATEHSFARDIYSLAYRYGKNRFGLERFAGASTLFRFCDATLEPRFPRNYGILARVSYAFHSLRFQRSYDAETSLIGFIRCQAERLIHRHPELGRSLDSPMDGKDTPEIWFTFVNTIANLTLADLAATFMKRLRNGQYLDLFHLLGSAGALYMMVSPYFAAFRFFATERKLATCIATNLQPGRATVPMKIACVADGLGDSSGIGAIVRKQLDCARKTGCAFQVLTIGEKKVKTEPGVVNFPPAFSWTESNDVAFRLSFPALLPVLDHVNSEGYSCLQAATVGPAGLTAILMGKLLGIPTYMVYHPELVEYLQRVTEDHFFSGMIWKYLAWFFNQCDMVMVQNNSVVEMLVERGVARHKLFVSPDGIEYLSVFLRRWNVLQELVTRNASSGTDGTWSDFQSDNVVGSGVLDGLEALFTRNPAGDAIRHPADTVVL